jgi:hypothetical protein
MPKGIAGLARLCWSENPKERPTFDDIVHFLAEDAKKDIEGMHHEASSEGGGATNRRTSTSGSLAMRLATLESEAAPKSKEDKLTEQVDSLKEELQNMVERLSKYEECRVYTQKF